MTNTEWDINYIIASDGGMMYHAVTEKEARDKAEEMSRNAKEPYSVYKRISRVEVNFSFTWSEK